jgi:hypothetical protein
MGNPNFTFVIGEPAEDVPGRSVEGRVLLAETSWQFEADLVRRFSSERYQFHRIALAIERPFDIFEFCFFYTMVSSGRFATNTKTGCIRAASASELPVVRAIQQAGFKIPDQDLSLSEDFKDDLASLEHQLKRIWKAEMVELAFARYKSGDGVTIVLDS